MEQQTIKRWRHLLQKTVLISAKCTKSRSAALFSINAEMRRLVTTPNRREFGEIPTHMSKYGTRLLYIAQYILIAKHHIS
ncbi:hypothetical protein D3C77_522180 [compost metagenome]